MLFAGGMGSGLLFWGVAEPVYHFEAPPGSAGGTAQAAREAMVITHTPWGVHARAIYGACALALAAFPFPPGEPPLPTTPLRPVLHGRTGILVDTLGAPP